MYITGNLLKRLKATKLCHYSWSRNISEETFARLGYTEKAYGIRQCMTKNNWGVTLLVTIKGEIHSKAGIK